MYVCSCYQSVGISFTFEAPTKMDLKMPSLANNCLTLLTNLSIEANSVDPDQTAAMGEV